LSHEPSSSTEKHRAAARVTGLRIEVGRWTECHVLPNFALAAATQLPLASPVRASHFSMATL
jgi:hypothetical protein